MKKQTLLTLIIATATSMTVNAQTLDTSYTNLDTTLIKIGNMYSTNPQAVVVDNNGYIWVAESMNGAVIKINANTNIVTNIVSVGQLPSQYNEGEMVADHTGFLWVVSGFHTVSKINMNSHAVESITVGENPIAIAIDNSNNAWVINQSDNTVSKIDAITHSVSTSGMLPMTPWAITTDYNNNAWVASPNASSVTKIDASTMATTIVNVGVSPQALKSDNNGYLWVVNAGGTLSKIDVNTNAVTSIPVGSVPYSLAFDNNGYVWVANAGDGTLSKVDTTTNITTTISIGGNPHLIVTDNNNGYAWVVKQSDGSVSKINTTTNQIINTVTVAPLGKMPGQLAIDHNGNAWVVADQNDNAVVKISNTLVNVYSHTACDSFIWHSTTYTTNGIQLYAQDGVTDTLYLTINYGTTGTDVITACDSYTWIDGNTYTASNSTATFTLTNAAGCDSFVTLNLTIKNTTTGTDVITACDSYTWIDGNTYVASNNAVTFTLTNASGCDSVVTLDLTINTTPHSNVKQNGVTLTADAIGVSYQWLDCANSFTPIAGENNQVFAATANGNYAVEVSQNGCSDTSDCFAITIVGILENSFNHEIVFYPNPTDGKLMIVLGEEYEEMTVNISTIVGKMIQTTDFKNCSTIEIDLNEPDGVYLITLISSHKKAVLKFIKN